MRRIDWTSARNALPRDIGLTRRDSLSGFLAAFAVTALVSEVSVARPARRMSAAKWIDRQSELARSLSKGEIRPLDWMREVERLAREVDPMQLMGEVDQARVSAASIPSTNDPQKRSIRFLDEHGAPRRLGYAAALFDFSPKNVVTPHGHRNMVSSHLITRGKFGVRNFDRLQDVGSAMRIRATRDYIAKTGHVSAMSSDRDNIHWFVPVDGPAQTFDIIISGLRPDLEPYEITAIDPLGGEKQTDGTILAPAMSFEDASRKYQANL